jgi:predicted GIY-YIG superfamily endonuclease
MKYTLYYIKIYSYDNHDDFKYKIGMTINVKQRLANLIKEYNRKYGSLKNTYVYKMIHTEEFYSKSDACKTESMIKSLFKKHRLCKSEHSLELYHTEIFDIDILNKDISE